MLTIAVSVYADAGKPFSELEYANKDPWLFLTLMVKASSYSLP